MVGSAGVLSALLDRVLSERSEDKLVFLINVQRWCACAGSDSQDLVSNEYAAVSAAERMGIDDESDQVP